VEGNHEEIIKSPRVREIYLGKEEAPELIEAQVEDRTRDTDSFRILSIKEISTGEGDLNALSEVSLDVFRGDIVALVGVSGSGKTTLINAVNRSIPLLSGDILFKGISIINKKPYEMAELGISQCVEGRRLFLGLTVRENLEIGAYSKRARAKWRSTMERVFDLFPVLAGRRDQIAGTLSVGEQRMAAIGCALMGLPEFIMLDELSHGLAPIIIEKLHEAILEINLQGITILLADQNIGQSLEIANRAYIIERGRIIRSGNPRELKQDEYIRKVFLGR
jgi:branched-chain amino acid transport system ATP-binding protein